MVLFSSLILCSMNINRGKYICIFIINFMEFGMGIIWDNIMYDIESNEDKR